MSHSMQKTVIIGLAALVAILLLSSFAGAQAPQILWWYDLKAPSFGSAAAGDIDGDGKLEIVFGTYFNDEYIHALNAEDGSLLWQYDTGGCNDASPVIADVDLDGNLEVVVPASSPCKVLCFDGKTGAVKWTAPTGSNSIDSPPAVADVDGDGKLEIVHGAFYGHVYCLNGEDGSQVWHVNLGTNSFIQSCPNLLDLEGDGDLDVVVAQWDGDFRIYALEGKDGSTLWYSEEPGDHMYHGGSFADVDGDGKPEIAIGCYDHNLYLLDGENGRLQWKYTAPFYIGAPTSMADLDNDGDLEIVFTSYNRLYVLSHQGAFVWSYTAGGSMFRGAAIADIDGDGIRDVAFGADDGILRVLRGSDGQVVWSFNLKNHYGQTFDIDHAPVIADFDNDGKLDIFVVGGHGAYPPGSNHGRAYALSAGDGAGPGWLMFRHDHRRSGCCGTFPLLEADAYTVSETTGAMVNLTLTAGLAEAGRNYLMLGSITGTEPGTPLPGGQAVLPLNWDAFTNLVVPLVNSQIFANFYGTLDASGMGHAVFFTLGPLQPGLVGLKLYYAYALNNPWNAASNPVAIEIVP